MTLSKSAQADANPHVRQFQPRSADEMSHALRGVDVEINVLKASKFAYDMLSAQLGEGVLEIGAAGMALASAGTVQPRDVLLAVPLHCEGAWHINGLPFSGDKLAVQRPGAEHFVYSGGNISWAALVLPVAAWDRRVAVLGDGRDRPLKNLEMMEVPRGPHAYLRQLAGRASAVLRDHAQLARTPAIRSALGETLLNAFVRMARPPAERAGRSPQSGFTHGRIIRTALAYLRAHPERLIQVADLCEVTGVSERTLRNAFNSAFGMGPIRYLRVRRLNQVHRLLRHPDEALTMVTEAAMRYAFFDLGRFARDYQKLFGEKPSATWARQRGVQVAVAGEESRAPARGRNQAPLVRGRVLRPAGH